MAIDRRERMVLINGQDRTKDIDSIETGEEFTLVTFLPDPSEAVRYRSSSVIILTSPDVLDPSLYQIRLRGRTISHLSLLLRFRKGLFVFYVYEKDNAIYSASAKELEVHASCLSDSKAAECFSYLSELSKLNRDHSADEPMLSERYSRLSFIDEDSLLSFYLKPDGKSLRRYPEKTVIFPFGGNESQFKAVRLALSNQLTVVTGAPGTGKTQTILNIVANLLLEGKTMLVVSKNRSALSDIWEKLERSGLGYLTAFLGSPVNKEYFLQNQPAYPAEHQAGVSKDVLRINSLVGKLEDVFTTERELSGKRQLLRDLEDEIRYFERFCDDNGIRLEEFRSHINDTEKLFDLMAKLLTIENNSKVKLFFFRLRCGIPLFLTRQKKPAEIVTLLKDSMYKVRKEGYEEDIAKLEEKLSIVSSEKLFHELQERSWAMLGAVLDKRIAKERPVFTEEDLWRNGYDVLKEYPVVLSTTDEATSCLHYTKYDYLIMDEASQTDIATGALALSVAGNAVIIGNNKELFDTSYGESTHQALFSRYDLDRRYELRDGNSFLSSISTLVPEEYITTLTKHYRSEPHIISYCDKEVFDGKLVIMTDDGKDPIEVVRAGADARDEDGCSRSECEVILSEVLPSLYAIEDKDIGIISPYQRQVELIRSRLEDRAVEVGTVERFQGKEKRVIIYSAVNGCPDASYGKAFNLALSRAREKFVLVVSRTGEKGSVQDFMDYAGYLDCDMERHDLYAVFDLLYGRNVEKRREILREELGIYEHDSETLVFRAIVEVLEELSMGGVKVVSHYPMRELLRHPDKEKLGDRRYSYVTNHRTHLDFLLYKAVSKRPVLAVEVDSFQDRSRRLPGKDRMKDEVLSAYGLPVLRVSPDSEDLRKRIRESLLSSL